MDLRLTEKHWAYGEAGLLFPAEQIKYAHWADRPLFEPVEDPTMFTMVYILLNNNEFTYLTFSTQELIRIVMLYMEPANSRYLQKMIISAEIPSVNHVLMLKAMDELSTIYHFGRLVNEHSFEFHFISKDA